MMKNILAEPVPTSDSSSDDNEVYMLLCPFVFACVVSIAIDRCTGLSCQPIAQPGAPEIDSKFSLILLVVLKSLFDDNILDQQAAEWQQTVFVSASLGKHLCCCLT